MEQTERRVRGMTRPLKTDTLRRLEVTVLAECVSCGQQRDIKEGEVAPGDHPCCNWCGSPMIAAHAKAKAGRRTK